MSLYIENQAPGQVQITRLLLIGMKKSKREYLSHAEIRNTARYLFPAYYLPDYALNPTIQTMHDSKLIASKYDQNNLTFCVTQDGRDFLADAG